MSAIPLTNVQTRTLIDEVTGATAHPESVLVWRELAFLDMGFAAYEATGLAETRIDLHLMRTLLSNGCPHQFAWQILLGTCFAGEDENHYRPPVVVVEREEDEEDGA